MLRHIIGVKGISVWRNQFDIGHALGILAEYGIWRKDVSQGISMLRIWIGPERANGMPSIAEAVLVRIAVLTDDRRDALCVRTAPCVIRSALHYRKYTRQMYRGRPRRQRQTSFERCSQRCRRSPWRRACWIARSPADQGQPAGIDRREAAGGRGTYGRTKGSRAVKESPGLF